MNKLSQLAIDLYKGRTTEFSKEDMNKALREELISLCGTDKLNYKTMRKVKNEVFEILEEALDILVGESIENEMSGFAEYRNVAWGDKLTFDIPNPNLFKVAVIADGTGNLRRQRIDNGVLTVETKMRGVKIYDEFYRFLSGRIDWIELVNRVSKSYVNGIYNDVYNAIYNNYSSLSATYGITGSFSASTLDTLVQHVEAATGLQAVIYGTKTALGKVSNAQISESMKDEFNRQRFLWNV